MVAATLSIAERQVARTLDLLEGGATIPFISRYRKEMTGGLDEVQIGEIKRVYDKLVETKGNDIGFHRGARQVDR